MHGLTGRSVGKFMINQLVKLARVDLNALIFLGFRLRMKAGNGSGQPVRPRLRPTFLGLR